MEYLKARANLFFEKFDQRNAAIMAASFLFFCILGMIMIFIFSEFMMDGSGSPLAIILLFFWIGTLFYMHFKMRDVRKNLDQNKKLLEKIEKELQENAAAPKNEGLNIMDRKNMFMPRMTPGNGAGDIRKLPARRKRFFENI